MLLVLQLNSSKRIGTTLRRQQTACAVRACMQRTVDHVTLRISESSERPNFAQRAANMQTADRSVSRKGQLTRAEIRHTMHYRCTACMEYV
jgi:hypothetical protein